MLGDTVADTHAAGKRHAGNMKETRREHAENIQEHTVSKQARI